jgi:outer membrane biosynthesis protein TonB
MKVLRRILLAVTSCGLLATTGLAEWTGENPVDAPRAIRTIAPSLGYQSVLRNEPGKATAEFFLDEEGRPVQIEVVETTATAYTDAVVDALRRWRFERAGETTPWTGVRYRLTFVFTGSDA